MPLLDPPKLANALEKLTKNVSWTTRETREYLVFQELKPFAVITKTLKRTPKYRILNDQLNLVVAEANSLGEIVEDWQFIFRYNDEVAGDEEEQGKCKGEEEGTNSEEQSTRQSGSEDEEARSMRPLYFGRGLDSILITAAPQLDSSSRPQTTSNFTISPRSSPPQQLHNLKLDLIPPVVLSCCDFLLEHGLQTEGIFRISSNKLEVDRVASMFESNQVIHWHLLNDSIHIAANVLKKFLRELREPIFPHHLYADFISLVHVPSKENQVSVMGHLLRQVPEKNRHNLAKLLELLQAVAKESEQNKMTVHNLAIIFSQTLFFADMELDNPLTAIQDAGKCTALVVLLLENFRPSDLLF